MSDLGTELAKITALVNSGFTTATMAYSLVDLDAMKAGDTDDRPQQYVEVSLTRVGGGSGRLNGRQGTRSRRITTRFVALDRDNAVALRVRAEEKLEGAELDLDGVTSTPIEFETEDDITPDDGWHSGLTTWTYTV